MKLFYTLILIRTFTMENMENVENDNQDRYVGVWQLIPKNAFLYFPEGQQIRVGTGEKQWRKIFEGNQKFDQFQLNALKKLQQKLVLSNIQVHPWFDNANKLRFLQANKWKNTPTCQAIAEYSRYRSSQFPIKETHQILAMLTKGTFYICGRDHQYRPIIVVDISKLEEKDVELIVPTLVYVMEFVINQLLIQGQVENYVLLMNLESFQFSQKNIVSKIMSFTSKSYRGRLFVSYILGAPFTLRAAWNGFASAFVSQNTLKKLKITGDLEHKDMWTHIDKEIIQKKYGGKAQNIKSFWPVSHQKLLYESPIAKNKLISTQEYNQRFSAMQLQNRKVLKHLLKRKTVTMRDLNKSTIILEQKDPISESKKVLQRIDRDSLTNTTILVQSALFPEDLKFIHPFFMGEKYIRIK